jgi:putative protease
MEKKEIGQVVHYYDKISVAVIELSKSLAVGDKILIEGTEGPAVEQEVKSMQMEHASVQKAKAGESIGLKVEGKVHKGNKVYKIKE